jgi:hypothetical protein
MKYGEFLWMQRRGELVHDLEEYKESWLRSPNEKILPEV